MDVDINSTEFPLIEPKLREFQSRLSALVEMVRSSPAAARAIGKKLTQDQARFSQFVTEYNRIRVLIGFSPAVGLGVTWFIAVGAAIAIATLWALMVLYDHSLAAREQEAQAAIASAHNQAQLITAAQEKGAQAEAARQKGDPSSYNQLKAEEQALYRQAGSPLDAPGAPQRDFVPWLQQNIGWLAVGAFAIFALPRLVEAVTD